MTSTSWLEEREEGWRGWTNLLKDCVIDSFNRRRTETKKMYQIFFFLSGGKKIWSFFENDIRFREKKCMRSIIFLVGFNFSLNTPAWWNCQSRIWFWGDGGRFLNQIFSFLSFDIKSICLHSLWQQCVNYCIHVSSASSYIYWPEFKINLFT